MCHMLQKDDPSKEKAGGGDHGILNLNGLSDDGEEEAVFTKPKTINRRKTKTPV